MSDQWLYWTHALKGEFLEDLIQRGNPQSGFYRDRNRAVAIWRDEYDGRLICSVSSGVKPAHDDQIDDLFGWVCRKPITREMFLHIRGGGKWPEDVEHPTIGDNSANRPLSEIILEQISAKKAEFDAWLAQIGGEIVSEAHATKAANFSDVFQKLEKRADEARKAEKAPLDEKVAEVQARWNPVVAAAVAAKKHIKTLWETFGRKEMQRKREEQEAARQAALTAYAEEARMAEERGEAAPLKELPLVEKVKVSAGTRGRIAMKTRKVVVVTDASAMLTYLVGLDPAPPELVEVATKITKRMLEAGAKVPGVELKTEEYAA